MKTCKHCGEELIIKQTQTKSSQLQQLYYYKAYYFCLNCRRIYHDDKFKVINHSQAMFNDQNNLSVSPADVEIWTDGACTGNGTLDAKAAWAFVSGNEEQAGLVLGKQTNNRAEAYAILYALQWAAKKGYRNIIIYTDSQISIFGVNKHFSKVKVNQDIFKEIADVINTSKLLVTYKKVLGHSGDVNNERVDKLANNLASH